MTDKAKLTKAMIEAGARAICLVDDCDPDALEPGNTPYGDDREFIDGELKGGPAYFLWRNYAAAAAEAYTAMQSASPRERDDDAQSRENGDHIPPRVDNDLAGRPGAHKSATDDAEVIVREILGRHFGGLVQPGGGPYRIRFTPAAREIVAALQSKAPETHG
jgi:hypothetical protein